MGSLLLMSFNTEYNLKKKTAREFTLKTRKIIKMARVSLSSLTKSVGLDTVYDKNEK